MKTNQFTKLLAACIMLGVSFAACKKDQAPSFVKPPVDETVTGGNKLKTQGTSSAYYIKAGETHNFVYGNLLTTYNSYRVNTTTQTTTAYEWYNISQIYADAAMVKLGATAYAPYMNNTFAWMNNMWDGANPNGGYYASANVNGTGASGDKYADDNALSGVAYLDAYDVTTGTTQTNYLNSAKACANWLMNSGQWDNTYGGGFWWNTVKESKPTQTNGLALQLFLRLYQITGQTYYRDWAISIKNWLLTNMLDTSTGLYIWKIDGAGSGTKHTEKFTYDNAIMVEAFLLYGQIMADNTYITKAQNLGSSMNTTLWNSTYHVYIFNTTDGRINPAWCVWGSQAMIKLYQRDGNTAWLDYAQQNIDYMNSKLRNTTNLGYYHFCNFDGSSVETRQEGVDQAWMQRSQAMLSDYR
ncbi:glycoside hydrolase family 76 protein [Mucilaginibacter sabulilitoris]|uniref:Glycoside hydrolase family 76 protein n=1 Tax=Mucilaginibacter sabulilitoris TaxID=1173583 RepID=A0ABZ0TGY4_9SPHI|nr:glycoside hydrolase family 76 protein [Mucilaginibacter sabulilitoris]WPU91672.1 glycoside hydrolase family 76 protein [Mucilaginibacter sabulilitoris]